MTKAFSYTVLVAIIAALLLFTNNHSLYKNSSIKEYSIQEYAAGQSTPKTISDTASKETIKASATFDPEISDAGNRECIVGYINEEYIPGGAVYSYTLNEEPSAGSIVWLEYDLYGVSDYSGISKSVNDQLSNGGYYVTRNNSWTHQKEMLHVDAVKQGINTIRFSTADNAKYSYRVKNIRLHVEEFSSERRIVFNQSGQGYYDNNKAYIQGFVHGKGSCDADVWVNGLKVETEQGHFENAADVLNIGNLGEGEVIVEARFADGEIIKEKLIYKEKSEYDLSYPMEQSTPVSKFFCNPASSFSICHGGVSLQGEIGDMVSMTTISAITLRKKDMTPLEEGMENVTGMGSGYRMLPHGVLFSKEIEIRIKYDPQQIPVGYSPEDIYTYFFDEESSSWVVLDRVAVDTVQNEIVSKTNHFTDFINGVIKAPEMPEVSAYTPTSITDLKVADPLAGIALISPPSANNNGSATTGLQIEVPAGRAGMQPSLSIQYNSQGGNGWMGLGWNITVPEISVETRWGVPRFDSQLETESYLINGEELTPQVQRSNYETRNASSDKQFYPVIEGSFSEIKRIGNTPSTYSWVVKDKSGMTYYYGLTSDSKLSASGGIVRWALSRVEDPNGNSVIYQYQTTTWNVSGSLGYGGKQMYLRKIIYTSTGATANGKYWVEFNLENLGTVTRNDIQVSMRSGMKETTGHRLKSVVVGYDSAEVSRYEMTYTEGAFGKSLLGNIAHYVAGKAPTAVKNYSFDYHTQNGTDPYFMEEEDTIAVPDAKMKDGTMFGEPSALGNNKGWQLGGELGAGVGVGLKVFSKMNSINGSYSHNWNWGKTLSTFMDIDGDGLSDKVVRDGENISYYRMILNPNRTMGFDTTEYSIGSLTNLGKDKSESNSIGLSGHFGLDTNLSVNVAGEYSWSKSKTKYYFTDVNSDGLVDFIDDDKVLFNKLQGGQPVFAGSTGNVVYLGGCDTIYLTNSIDPNMFEDVEPAMPVDPLTDVVKVWIAPYDGNVEVGQSISFGSDPSSNGSNPAEMVKYSIEHNNTMVVVDEISTQNTGSEQISKTINGVEKGDKIFFRLFDNENVNFNEVEWHCRIKYLGQNTQNVDADSKTMFSFESDEDYTVTNKSTQEMPFDGQIRLQGVITSPALSDTVAFQIVRNNQIIKQKTFVDNTSITYSLDTIINVDSLDLFHFYLKSNTQVEWSAVSAKFSATYDSISTIPAFTVDTSLEAGTVRFQPYIEYSLFPNDYLPSKAHSFTSKSCIPYIRLSAPYIGKGTAQVVFSVKQNHNLLAETTYNISSSFDTLIILPALNLPDIDSVYFDFYTKNNAFAGLVDEAYLYAGGTIFYEAGFHSDYPDSMAIFGNLNRNWGQFTYKQSSTSSPIDESLLKMNNITDNMEDAFADMSDTSNVSQFDTSNVETGIEDLGTFFEYYGFVNPLDEVFGYMYLDMTDDCWKGSFGKCRIDEDLMHTESLWSTSDFDFSDVEIADQGNPSNVYENETLTPEDLEPEYFYPYPVVQPGQRVVTVARVSQSDSWSLSASFGPTMFSPGLNVTKTTNKQMSDFMDMNGDGFPDAIDNSTIHYTTPYGDFEDTSRDISSSSISLVSKNISRSAGPSAGTNFINNEHKGNKYKISVKGSLGASGISGNSIQAFGFADVNGDGLPDFINCENNNTYIKLNNGYGFEAQVLASTLNYKRENTSTCFNVNLGGEVEYEWLLGKTAKDKFEGSLSFGIAFTFSNDGNRYFPADINGDGLTDRVKADSSTKKLYVSINKGTGYDAEEEMINLGSKFKENKSNNQSINVGITFGFPFIVNKLIVSLSGNASKSSTATRAQLADINNDGFPDLVFSESETEMKVHYSTLGKVNMLKDITNPSGGVISMNYGLTRCSQENPNRVMALTELYIDDMNDGDGVDGMASSFEYKGGYYDRERRSNYGFDTVITKNHYWHRSFKLGLAYRIMTEVYRTDAQLFKGLKKYESVADAAGNIYSSTEYTYQPLFISTGDVVTTNPPYCDGTYPGLTQEDAYFYEGAANYSIHTQKKYYYTSHGNIDMYEDYGDVADADDDVRVVIGYSDNANLLALNMTGLADTMRVYELDGTIATLKRKRTAIYDSQGNMTSVSVHNGTNVSTSLFTYYSYGSIHTATGPQDVNNFSKTITIIYDPQVSTYPDTVRDESGYFSSATYDYRIGKPLSTTDRSNQQMTFTYDIDGRLLTVRGPNEIVSGATYTIKHEYPANGSGTFDWAVTRHYNPGYTDIYTVQFADGLGRPIQTKKTATVYNASTGLNEDKIIVSGRQYFDDFGRVDSVKYPVADAYNLSTITTLSTTVDAEPPTIMSYDILDRTTSMTNPEGETTLSAYGFGTDKYSKTRFLTTLTDAKLNVTQEYKDARGLKTTVKDALNGQTGFVYDALGQLANSSDPENYSTTYLYDMVGQLLSRTHPDAGTTSYTYDNAGHVRTTRTQNLINNNDSVEYVYSQGRLSSIEYPQNPEMNVYYQYGPANTGNQSGRLIKQQDFSGVQTFEYGRMGELTANKRSFVLPNGTTYTFKMMWVYDSWNRVKTMTYPDGDVATYTYQKGGQLNQVVTTKPTQSSITLVSSLGYDKFGSRVMLQYGNGTKMYYSYDAQSRRMSNLTSYNGASPAQQMQNINYSYDDVGNITAISNSAAALSNGLGDEYSHTYTYDDLYRLTDATGSWKRGYCNYTMNMDYSASGRIESKYQNAYVYLNQAPVGILRNYTYSYNGTNKPHAVRSVGTGTSADYDANGNMTAYTNAAVVGTMPRELTWDEENRLSAVGDGRYMSAYTYDAGGERVLKYAGAWQQMTIGGLQIINFANLNERKTLYMGGHMVLTNTNYTKHYYMGSERIHTRIGGGFLNAPNGGNFIINSPITPLLSGSSYATLSTAMTTKIRRDAELVGYDSVAMPTAFSCMGSLISANNSEINRYFYHPDHLGSSSFITNSAGTAVHHLQYLPFGEAFVEQRIRLQPWYTPYKFSGKEKDEETSLSYFGARYYDSDLSVFISIDAFADKYPNLSPYNYCSGNPINAIDVGGDSTRYYHNGELLFISHDNLPNAVVDVSMLNFSDQTVAVLKYLGSQKQIDPLFDSDGWNSKARTWGIKYFTDEYEKFYNENHGLKNSKGAIAERGFLMNLNYKTLEMEIIPDVIIEAQGVYSDNINYDKDINIYTGKPYPYRFDSDGHLHNYGTSTSTPDQSLSNNGSGKFTYDIMINDKKIYFMNKLNSEVFEIPKTGTYER